ncbi:hemin uptake protein hemP [Yoonia maricola]|uniref:Hemin uptake protein hemP n=1 Tax=Yoonia maricola TaxID=420999 RepID=A0A2M8W0G8_9RHOB|nr:hemin uptake protein HemP [Yoonia maricola]PJI84412.1 hemin uptake protein hemP [Yoonia maricola]
MGLQKAPPVAASVLQNFPSYDARELIKDGDQAHIILDDQVYVLRITRAGKLILTK